MGMSERQVVFRAELPLAVPLMMTGIRTAAVQVVATATLAALLGGGTLGSIIRTGFARQDNGVVVAGALLVAALAVLTEVLLTVVARLVTPGQRQLPFRRRPARPVDAPDPLLVRCRSPSRQGAAARSAERPVLSQNGQQRRPLALRNRGLSGLSCAPRDFPARHASLPDQGARDTEGGHPMRKRARHPRSPRPRGAARHRRLR